MRSTLVDGDAGTSRERGETDRWMEEASRAFVEFGPDAVVISGSDGHMILVNCRTEAMFGYPRSQLIGQPIEMLLPERFRETHVVHRSSYAAEPIARPMGAGFELFGLRSDGTEFRLDISLSSFRTSRGPVFSATLRNNTERRRADKFGLLLESAPDAVIVIEGDGQIALVNAQTEQLFGFPREQLIGHPVEILMPRRFRDAHIRHRVGYVGEPYRRPMDAGLNLYGQRADGSEFPLDISLAPVETDQGMLIAATVRDVTDRKRLEGARDEFIHHAAHELRTPLATLGALSETLALRMGEMSEQDVSDALGALMRQGERANKLVANLLDLSQLESGHADVGLVPVDLADTVSRALEGAPAPTGKTVTVDLDEPFVLVADHVQLERVFTNLLTNAYRYGGSQIRVGAQRSESDVVVTFADDGDGVPDDLVDSVFEPFVRGKTAALVGGSGVGLALCRRIVGAFGGSIWYDASAQGAFFKFRVRELQ